MTMDELRKSIQEKTIKNRDQLYNDLKQYSTKTVIEWLIEKMKYYSQEGETLTGQYMMTLDAVHRVLLERRFIDNYSTWTLEEFLNDYPFHSAIVDTGQDDSEMESE